MNKVINRVMLADSYKYSHAKQYPNMVSMYDYMESRGGVYPATVFVGLSGMLKEYFEKPITLREVYQAHDFAKAHGVPFDIEGWEYIVSQLDGKLPIRIKAVPEGSLIPTGNVLLTIESTDENVPWIAGWMETILMKLWYPTTIATKSYYVKQMLEKYGSPEWAQFAYHNFGDRGSSSVESAAIGGFAHLTQFKGTDNFNALKYCFDNYDSPIAGFSVFATEHSTTTSYGRNGEEIFVIKMLMENPDAPIMSFVADSYDVYEFTDMCTKPGSKIREIIESRPNQKLILRPDSGEPINVLNRMLKIMNANGVFDTVINGKLASSNFGILWGDGITPETIERILKTFTQEYTGEYGLPYAYMYPEEVYAAENFLFGSGGDLLQNVNRDTQKFAIKCSSITIEKPIFGMGEDFTSKLVDVERVDIDVFKDPVTDPGKTSKKGRITTYYNSDTSEYQVGLVNTGSMGLVDMLETVYENGIIIKTYSLDEIRKVQ